MKKDKVTISIDKEDKKEEKYNEEFLNEVSSHSMRNREEIMKSKLCGCYYCETTFAPDEIEYWIDDDENDIGQTARCPNCSIDSVIGDSTGYNLSKELLAELHYYAFEKRV